MEMAQPLLDFLEGRARAFLPFLRTGAAAGVKATAVIDVLRAFGIPFTTQRVLDIYAALQNRADLPRYLRLVPQTIPLPPEAHTINVVYEQVADYNYLVSVFHPATGRQEYITVASDIALSQANIRAQVDALFSGEKYQISLEEYPDATVTIEDAKVREGVI